MNLHWIYSPFLRYFRSRRNELFHAVMDLGSSHRILDVGGYHWFWTRMGCKNPITCLNIILPEFDAPLPPQFTYVQGDGRLLPFHDKEYDIVFSNSVIEHLGRYEDQMQFASEIRRVAQCYWVQTPSRWFPVEPHLITPLVHYLPKRAQNHLLRWFTVWGIVTTPTREQVAAFLAEVRLLTEREMRELFPDATIMVERFVGFKKSFIAVKTTLKGRQ